MVSPPPPVGAALVQFVPSDVITFPLVPGAAYVSVDATKVVPLFLRIVQDVVPALVITRTHSTAMIPALTRERVVSEACQSSIVEAQNACVILPASCAYTVSKYVFRNAFTLVQVIFFSIPSAVRDVATKSVSFGVASSAPQISAHIVVAVSSS